MMEHKNMPLTQKQTEVNLKTKLNICSKNQLSNASMGALKFETLRSV